MITPVKNFKSKLLWNIVASFLSQNDVDILSMYGIIIIIITWHITMYVCATVSGGVMIYFDRVEVVNVLSASAGSQL